MVLMNPQVVVRILTLIVISEYHVLIKNLGARNCTTAEFRCVTSGECIPEAWVCDHEVETTFVCQSRCTLSA